MGVIRTDEWLEQDFENVFSICKRMKKSFEDADEKEIFQFLYKKGLYKPSKFSKIDYHKLKKIRVWEKIDRFFHKYKKKWNGPDIPIYIFPIRKSINMNFQKTGISFKDKMILFLSPLEDDKEYEALFVHEYHHASRMNQLIKPLDEYTLLDSIIMEGLAEHAVLEYCGSEYLAKWCEYYSDKMIKNFWNFYLSKNLNIKLDDPMHDVLLYGMKQFPKMVGYACGFYLINEFKKKNHFSTKTFLDSPPERFLID